MIEYKACPICESADFKPRLKVGDLNMLLQWTDKLPREMTWCKCSACGHEFTKHYWENDELMSLVNQHYGEQGSQSLSMYRMWAHGLIDKLNSDERIWGENAWLDWGFGDGALLGALKEHGVDCMGFEISQTCLDAAKKAGLPVTHTLERDETYQVVTCLDVLEHQPFPRKLIERLACHVAPRGRLVISTPRRDCHAFEACGDGNPYYSELEHHHVFSAGGLKDMLAEAKFAIESYHASSRYLFGMMVVARRV